VMWSRTWAHLTGFSSDTGVDMEAYFVSNILKSVVVEVYGVLVLL
jgi:hypothetical protein